MKHYGDITKLSGYDLPVVDVITGGSPCQDLSVAGKREGLDGERSGLFMEQIRIVKEMRERDRSSGRADEFVRPRYMVWENVPGAFSSNGGRDFQTVLTEIVKIAEPDSPDVPMPDRGGWTKSGCLYDEMGRWSIAWRVHDAQFWGVPQRRKRIALVADFGGLSAPEICFERKGLSGNSEKSGKKGQGIAETVGRSVSSTITATYGTKWNGNAGAYNGENFVIGFNRERCGAVTANEIMPTLQAAAGESGNNQPMVCVEGKTLEACKIKDALITNPKQEPIAIEMTSTKNTIVDNGISPTLTARMGTGGNQVNAIFDAYQHHGYRENSTVGTLTKDQNNSIRGDTPLVMSMHGFGEYKECNCASTLKQRDYKDATDLVVYTGSGYATYKEGVGTIKTSGGDCGYGSENLYIDKTYQKKSGSLMASGYGRLGTQKAVNDMFVVNHIVRRLTPLECERLQGFPDGWTLIGEPENIYDEDGNIERVDRYYIDSSGKRKKVTDSARYKALGNSIATPFWQYLARRICAQYERDITVGSLFDGISGFPYVFKRCGAKTLWTSEIEEFPIAVCKQHFGDEKTGSKGDVANYI